MTTDRTPDSEIDWNKMIQMSAQMEQQRKSNMAVTVVKAAFRLFFAFGMIMLAWMIVDFVNGIRNGTIEPPTHSELAILAFLVSDLAVMLAVYMLIRRL